MAVAGFCQQTADGGVSPHQRLAASLGEYPFFFSKSTAINRSGTLEACANQAVETVCLTVL